MSWLTLQQVADAVGGELHGADASVESVSTDTRVHMPEALFVALRGERFDAHEALVAAAPDFANGLLVQRLVDHPAPQVLVDDTLAALGRLAAWWRWQMHCTVIGLTGSNGKTTVKEMLSAICSQQGDTLATRGNFNNHIGMPLTLLQLRPHHRYAVIEMGANHAGEIDYLSRICAPDIALLNNAGAAHLEGFGSIEGVASAKAEIFNGLGENGVAVINRDDEFAGFWLALNEQRRVVTFGRDRKAEVRLESDQPLVITRDGKMLTIPFTLLGAHNALNAAAAVAAATAAGLEEQAVVEGLSSMRAVRGRLCLVQGEQDFLLIDDTYNANPRSMMAAIDVLAAQDGATWLVMGAMAELGTEAEELHLDVARYARDKGIDHLLALGPYAELTAREFGAAGKAFATHQSLIARLTASVEKNDSVLVKGSRSMQMERVVDALSGNHGQSAGGDHAA